MGLAPRHARRGGAEKLPRAVSRNGAVTLAADDGRTICERCVVADRPLARMRGLLGRRRLPRGEGLLLRPASSVHTFFMRFPIDVVFLDDDLRVRDVRRDVSPWRAAGCRGSRAVLELPAGECERRGLRPGDALHAAANPS